jgi:hypothetical protein
MTMVMMADQLNTLTDDDRDDARVSLTFSYVHVVVV